MTKAEFVEKYAKRTKMTRSQAAGCVQAFWAEIEDSLKTGETIQFAGYGKFTVSKRDARQGVNPRDPSQRIQIPARTVPKFTPGSLLKRAVDSPKRGGKRGGRKKK
jgi:DNA-binding protein HU-beta